MNKQELEAKIEEHVHLNNKDGGHSCSFCGHKFSRERPVKDSFELDELCHQLLEAQEENSEIQLSVWKRDPIAGKLIKLDGQTNLVHIANDSGVHKIPFLDILKVGTPDVIVHVLEG